MDLDLSLCPGTAVEGPASPGASNPRGKNAYIGGTGHTYGWRACSHRREVKEGHSSCVGKRSLCVQPQEGGQRRPKPLWEKPIALTFNVGRARQEEKQVGRELSRVGCVWGQEPNFADFERKVVKSIPPVELHVGRVATDSPKLVLLIYSAIFGTF